MLKTYKRITSLLVTLACIFSAVSIVFAEETEIFPVTFTDETSVENFFNTNKTVLEIDEEVLSQNIELLKLAYNGETIGTEDDFWYTYINYEKKANLNILKQIYNSENTTEFETLISKYADYMDLDLDAYNKISDKTNLMKILKDCAFDIEGFKKQFEEITSNTTIVNNYTAYEACMIGGASDPEFNTSNVGGQYMKPLIVKYNVAGVDLSSVSKALLRVKCTYKAFDGSVQFAIRVLNSSSWNPENYNYNKFVTTEGTFPGTINSNQFEWIYGDEVSGDYYNVDVTSLLRKFVENHGSVHDNVSFYVLVNTYFQHYLPNDKTDYNPLVLETENSNYSELTYSIQSGREEVPVNQTEIDANAQNIFEPDTVLNDNIIITKNDIVLDSNKYEVSSHGNKISVRFKEDLEYDSVYKITPTREIEFQNDAKKYNYNSLIFKTEKNSFDFSQIKLVCKGEMIDDINNCKGKTVKSVVSLSNTTGNTENYVLIASLYEKKDGYIRMISSDVCDGVIADNGNRKYVNDFAIPSDSDVQYYISYNIWDGLTTMNKLFYQSK